MGGRRGVPAANQSAALPSLIGAISHRRVTCHFTSPLPSHHCISLAHHANLVMTFHLQGEGGVFVEL